MPDDDKPLNWSGRLYAWGRRHAALYRARRGRPPPAQSPADPALTLAGREIEAVLAKWNLGGAVVLSSGEHSQLLLCFPPWSAIQVVDSAVQAHFPQEGDERAARASLNILGAMAHGIAAHLRMVQQANTQILEGLRKHPTLRRLLRRPADQPFPPILDTTEDEEKQRLMTQGLNAAVAGVRLELQEAAGNDVPKTG